MQGSIEDTVGSTIRKSTQCTNLHTHSLWTIYCLVVARLNNFWCPGLLSIKIKGNIPWFSRTSMAWGPDISESVKVCQNHARELNFLIWLTLRLVVSLCIPFLTAKIPRGGWWSRVMDMKSEAQATPPSVKKETRKMGIGVSVREMGSFSKSTPDVVPLQPTNGSHWSGTSVKID